MRYIWQLACRNLGRNKLRTLISILAIAVSIAIVIFARGLLIAARDSQINLQIMYNSGDLKIVTEEYRTKEKLLPLDCPVDGFTGEGYQNLVAELEGLNGINVVMPRIKFAAMVSQADMMEGMLGLGVIPEKEVQVTDIERYIKNGRFIQSGREEVVMGQELLEKLNLTIGDRFTLLFNTAYASLRGVTFTVVGAIESGIKLLDDGLIYLPLDVAQEMLDMPGEATELLIFTTNPKVTSSVTERVESLLDQNGLSDYYTVIPWYRSSQRIQSLQASDKIYNIIYALIILLGSFVVINTMLMIVKERTQEIGMISAMGLKGKEILGLFVAEGTVLGVFGSLVGVLIGGVITKILSVVGMDFSMSAAQAGKDALLLPVLYPIFSMSNLIFAFILGVIITALACTIPARRAAKLSPTEALRKI